MPELSHEELSNLMEKLNRERALDFRGYKPTSLSRRVQRRLDATKCSGIASYTEFLDRRPDEYAQLIDSLLINVTEFFRDPEAWDVLQTTVLPQIVAGKKPGDQVRVWSAGCATGEEPYSLAIALSETIGPRIADYDVRIYATDIDDHALAIARRAEYSEESLKPVTDELRQKYFVKNHNWALNRNTRKMVMFGRHNLVTDAPISHVDLIVCRNVLIYMSIDLQNRLLTKFHYGLQPRGFLFLGKAESLLTASKVFRPANDRWRIFRKESPPGERALVEQQTVSLATNLSESEFQTAYTYNEAVLRHSPAGVIGLDDNNVVQAVNQAAESLWAVGAADLLGRSILEAKLPEQLRSVLPHMTHARSLQREMRIEEMDLSAERGAPLFVSLAFSPLFDVRGNRLGIVIVAENITTQVRLRRELEALNEQLQATNEELETTNEELQSTNEELETTNEELQSTNEELETTNEELQSTNEELSTTNDELGVRTAEMNSLGLYLSSVLNSLDLPVVALDESDIVTTWNPAAERFYGLKAADALGTSLFALNIPLRVARNRQRLAKVKETRKSYRSGPIPYRTRTGDERQVVIEYQPLIDEEGNYKGALSIVRDAALEPLQPVSP